MIEATVSLSVVLTVAVTVLVAVCGFLSTHAFQTGKRCARLEGWIEAYDKGLGASIKKIEDSVETLRKESRDQHAELGKRVTEAMSSGDDKRSVLHGRINDLSDRLTAVEAVQKAA